MEMKRDSAGSFEEFVPTINEPLRELTCNPSPLRSHHLYHLILTPRTVLSQANEDVHHLGLVDIWRHVGEDIAPGGFVGSRDGSCGTSTNGIHLADGESDPVT